MGVPGVMARNRGAGKNSCNSINSRVRSSCITRVERGSPVSHTSHFGGAMAAMEVGADIPNDAKMEDACWSGGIRGVVETATWVRGPVGSSQPKKTVTIIAMLIYINN